MTYIYKLENLDFDPSQIEKLEGVESVEKKDGRIIVTGTVKAEEIEKLIASNDKYTKFVLPVSIDCAECAREVEEELKKDKNNAYVSFSYQKGKLTVITKNQLDDIKAKCRKVEDEIVFLDEKKIKKYTFNVSIDCAECAKKVENALKENENIEEADFNFPKGKLTVKTILSEEEVKALCRLVEDDISFIGDEKNYVFSVTIDCAECARKVEDALRKNENVKKASFDYPKGKLYVTTTLSEEDVRSLCLSVEDEMVFHTANICEKKDYAMHRIIISLVFFLIAKVFNLEYIAIISYLIAGYDVLLRALKNICKGKIFDENFLMSIATVAAICISSYDEAAAVMIFYQIGEYFQRKATQSSRSSIGKLMDLSSDSVTIKKDGEWLSVKPDEVKVGDTILLKSGEKLAVDSTVIEGESFVDTRALTGESVPVKVKKGSSILSGSVNGESSLTLRAEKEYSESTASKIMKLVENSEGKKAESEKFITKFSRYYTPFVCISALLIAILPPLFSLTEWKESIYRAAMLLVISCPCALVLSVPLTYFASMGSFARHGILVKGDDAIQNLSRVNTVALDKTGTLTEGVFSVQNIEYLSCSKEHLLDCVYALEKESTHPIATAIMEYAGKRDVRAENVHNIPGVGIEGDFKDKHIKAGSSRIMDNAPEIKEDGTLVYVVEDDSLLGVLVISDKIRDTSYSTVRDLRTVGVESIVMLSGDRKERAETTAVKLGLDRAYGELLPSQKLEKLEELKKNGKLLYAGDGINDAPALKSADVGVAMGGVGSDTAIEAADAVIMKDDLTRLPIAIRIAKKTENITKENIYLSLIVKASVFILAAIGLANMWYAVFADTGVCLLAVANAMRAMSYKEKRK